MTKLGASLLSIISTGKRGIKAGEGAIARNHGRGIIRTGLDF